MQHLVKSYDVQSASLGQLIQQIRVDFCGIPFKWRSRFGLKSEYIAWVRDGSKCTTIRYRPDAIDVPTGVDLPLLESDDASQGRFVNIVRIKNLVIKPFSMLDDQDARRDGFKTKDILQKTLQTLYSPIYDHCIKEEDYVTIYTISFLEPQSRSNTFDK